MPKLNKELQTRRSEAVSKGAYVLTAAQYKKMKKGEVIIFGAAYHDMKERICPGVLLAGIDLE